MVRPGGWIIGEWFAPGQLTGGCSSGGPKDPDRFAPLDEIRRALNGGVFEVLKEVEQFKQFSVDETWGTVTWQDGALDIAPETLYFEATGAWPVQEPMMQVAEEPPQYGTSSEE